MRVPGVITHEQRLAAREYCRAQDIHYETLSHTCSCGSAWLSSCTEDVLGEVLRIRTEARQVLADLRLAATPINPPRKSMNTFLRFWELLCAAWVIVLIVLLFVHYGSVAGWWGIAITTLCVSGQGLANTRHARRSR